MVKKTTYFCLAMVLFSATSVFAFDLSRIHGFVEGAGGARFKDDTTKHDAFNMLETRVQLKARYYPEQSLLVAWNAEIDLKADAFIDGYFAGKTGGEVREANIFFSPLRWLDIKAGRQVFTWGTGDYLFINDLFPKDYVSFYIGRDDEYLKKPSDGVKFSFYSEIGNLDIIAIPFFEPNTIFNGERLSFFDAFQGGVAGRESDRVLLEPPYQAENMELAARFSKTVKSYELALYGFRGFDKMPRAYKNEALRQLYYPRLNVVGASVRGPVLGGIGNAEVGYYDAEEDRDGDDRLAANSMFKALIGYDRDMGNDLRIGAQYQYEEILKYDEYRGALLAGDFFWDEYRHLLTLRVTKLLMQQRVRASLFTFWSPSDEDVYVRPSASYDITDRWKVTVGANLIWGESDQTDFGQMERNSNVYARVRFSF